MYLTKLIFLFLNMYKKEIIKYEISGSCYKIKNFNRFYCKKLQRKIAI
jgi:hypothetical protein